MSNVSPLRISASELIAVDNDVTLPDPRSGRLGELFAAAEAPGQSHELTWEFGARTAFNTESLAWSTGRRHLRRSPAVVAVVAVASLLLTTTGLAAATGVPAPAARVVDHVLRHIDQTNPACRVTPLQSLSRLHPAEAQSSRSIRFQRPSGAMPILVHASSLCGSSTAHPERGGRGSNSNRSWRAGAVHGRVTTSQRSQSNEDW